MNKLNLDWEETKILAAKKGLDALPLYRALQELEPIGAEVESETNVTIFNQAVRGEFSVLPKGTISMDDKAHPSRFELNHTYQSQKA